MCLPYLQKARELNLIDDSDDIVITSDRLNQMSDDEIREVFDKVFIQRVVEEEMFDKYIIEEPKNGQIYDFTSIKR